MEDCISPPYSSENVAMKKELTSCLGESSEIEQNNVKAVQNNENNRRAFLCAHPSPCLQGPFLRPLGQKFLDQTFADFTSFKHGDAVKCGFWSPEEDSANNYKTKHSRKDIMFKSEINIVGPCSTLDGCVLYCCSVGMCQVGCPCHLCMNPFTCSKSCLDDPCDQCDKQCKKHKVGISRSFDENEDLFTIVTKPAVVNKENASFSLPKRNCEFVRFARIPRSCQECTRNLKDHEVNHKVFHFRCKFCRYQFGRITDSVSMVDLERKRKYLLRKEDETCSFCFKIYNRKVDRIIHEKNAHLSEKLKCEICGRAFQSELTLAKHIKTYHEEQILVFECDECGKAVSTKDILSRHKKTVHRKEFITCEECGLQVSRENHMNRHMSEVHGVIKNINLDFAPADLQNFKRFQCDICRKAFTRKETLKRHKSSVHSETSEILCNYCDKTFGRPDNARRHEAACKEGPLTIAQSIVEEILDSI